MRISNHISLLHVVGVAGAIGLAIGTGLLMRMNEAAAHDATRAAEQDARLGRMIVDGYEIVGLVKAAQDNHAESVVNIAQRSAQRWREELSHFESAEHMGNSHWLTQASGALSDIASSVDASNEAERLDQFRADTEKFLAGLKGLEPLSKRRVHDAAAQLENQRRFVMLSIGLMCAGFLLIIEHTRYWTMRRLVRPVEQLAGVALRAMHGDEQIPRIEQCGTAELNDLSRMLSSFVNTLKLKVAERTSELERQKADLEHEVAVRRRAEEQLRHSAFHDRLTGLCNRDLLMDRIDRCIDRTRRNPDYLYAVLFLDIDRFKEVNDSHGHTLGDQFLITIANRLQSCLRKSDALAPAEGSTVARIGGDEFVVLLDGIQEPADALLVAERIQEALAAPIVLEGVEFFTSASIGIATSDLSYRSPDDLLRDADAAMYSAKAAGKARHEMFNERMHAEVKARLKLGNDLRRAVDNQEFRAYYQPICSLDTGQLIGFETLVRWEHPERGLVSPSEFIEHTEETGLVVELGRWIMGEACRQLRTWHGQFSLPDLTMSVNVSMRQASRPTLITEVRDLMEALQIPRGCLKLEITESVIMGNMETITEVLRALRELGVEVHMDDFGTGYSSLSYLHRFPLDALKIDRTFLAATKNDHDYAGIVKTVVTLAHHLNMRVTVEGVETHDQFALLRTLGADHAQGYYFAQPLDAETATELLAANPRWTLDAEAA